MLSIGENDRGKGVFRKLHNTWIVGCQIYSYMT